MSKFRVGDKVVCIALGGNKWITIGNFYIVTGYHNDEVFLVNDEQDPCRYNEALFELHDTSIYHPHYDLIVAWAKGAKIQQNVFSFGGWKWCDDPNPVWSDRMKYRVKPPEDEAKSARISELADKIRTLTTELEQLKGE